ncbi:peptidylprolyl isomerase [Mangrovicoccus algicola]|uniref:Parvulin-like PPIase n=1 Tax=Mangrovicoccus algicola TaxID=2771008 RepID=A0A8J7CH21_9RHOB|nr:peptidylprolyl isomerase [Mangrovicoccus algicola]MBE3637770.1 peptidylprolyl isomerase [Mangrovicoccus algicola]
MLKTILQGVRWMLVLCLGWTALPAAAQSPFDAVVRVNESVITRFEIDQRLKFLTLLRQPGVNREGVIDSLIDERLQMAEARRLGQELTEDQTEQAMAEFAARANLGPEEFIAAIGQEGVAPETFRDFVRSGAAWREVVRQRFSRQARVSDEEIDRAIALGTGQGTVQVQLAEIVLPLMPETAGEVRFQAEAIQQMNSFGEFSQAARDMSASSSGEQGGALGWVPLSDLPEQIAPLFLSMAPGDVTPPLPLPNVNAIALFQLRGIRDSRPGVMQNVELDYLVVRTAQGAAATEMARVKPLISTCGTLYTHVAQGNRIEEVTGPRAETAAGIRAAIDTLDPLEMTVLPGNSAFVMLCGRTPIPGADLSRDDLQRRLFQRKLESLADGYLAELRANAFVERS